MPRFALLAIALFCCTACSPPISRPSLDLIDQEITFASLRQNPDRYLGRYLLLGGTIVAVNNYNGGSELEVVQHATDNSGRITSSNRSDGRFLIRLDSFSEPAVLLGRLVTVVGKVEGKKSARLGELDYLYPVLSSHELRLWSPEERPDASRVRFGIGLGFGTMIH